MKYIDLVTFSEFISINKFFGIEMVYFSMSTMLIVVLFLILYYYKKIDLERRERLFFSLFKIILIIFVALIFRIHISVLFLDMQSTSFSAENMAGAIYGDILRYGTLLYELIFFMMLYMLFKAMFFIKSIRHVNKLKV